MSIRLKHFWRQVRVLAKVIRAFSQPSLKSRVVQEVKEHLRANSEFRTRRYSYAVRLSRWMVRNPFISVFIVAIPYFISMFFPVGGLSGGLALADDSQASMRDFWTVNIGVLTVQAALLGLVFPLVIAFVGLLNQGRASFSSRLTIYIESSNAVFVGVSSLLLCVTISAQLPFAAQIGIEGTGTALTALNLVWFAINSLALACFVLRTVAFLHPARRAPIIRDYTANAVWPLELTAAVTSNRWDEIDPSGDIPTRGDPLAAESSDFGGGRAQTWYSLSRHLNHVKKLDDVRLATLAPIVEDCRTEARNSQSREEPHHIDVPLLPGDEYKGDTTLIRATLPLSTVSRWAAKFSFKFRKAPSDNGAINKTSQILQEMIADLIALIDTRQANEFASQMIEIVYFHAFLYRLAQSSSEGCNYAQYKSGKNQFSASENWTLTYRDMIHRAVERLPDEPEFIRRITYAPSEIYSRVSQEVTPVALKPLLQLSERLIYEMIDWAWAEHRAESESRRGDKQPYTLMKNGEMYTRSWCEQVAAWERMLKEILSTPPDQRDERSWITLQGISENAVEHLHVTSQIAARAIWDGDKVAVTRICVLLLRWRNMAEDALGLHRTNRQLQSEALTLKVPALGRTTVQSSALLPSPKYSAQKVFDEDIGNAWLDYTLSLTNFCIYCAIHRQDDKKSRFAAKMLLNGHEMGDGSRIFSGTDVLISAFRIIGSRSQFSDVSYTGWIKRLDIGKRNRISGRPYSSRGGPDFGSLTKADAESQTQADAKAQAIVIMATSFCPQEINEELRRLLTQADDEALRKSKDYLENLLKAFGDDDSESHIALLIDVLEERGLNEFDRLKEHAKQLVQESLDVLNQSLTTN